MALPPYVTSMSGPTERLGLHRPEFDLEPWDGPARQGYVVCVTPRSGSHYFSSLLFNAGLGAPMEYFNPAEAKDLIRRLSPGDAAMPVDAYIAAVRRVRTSRDGLFGVTAHPQQMPQAIKLGLLERHLPNLKFVHLRRRDLVLQAVSLSVARQTGSWTSSEPVQAEPVYRPAEIAASIEALFGATLYWKDLFRQQAAPSMSVPYEDLSQDPGGMCARIAAFLGVSSEGDRPASEPLFARQGSDRNRAWAERFRQDDMTAKTAAILAAYADDMA